MDEHGSERSGDVLGSYRRGHLLGEGSFSWVYEATQLEGGLTRAVKVPKRADELGAGTAPTGVALTGVFAWATGALREVKPDTSELLRVQFDMLSEIGSPDLIGVEELAVEAGSAWYAMELVEGQTLRQLLGTARDASKTARKRRARVAAELAACLRRLEQNPSFRYHGDLKPDNVIVSGERVVLIDPGYYGPLRDADGHVSDCIVTTPTYYPWLDPREDLLAFGLVLWELLLGYQPLSRIQPPETVSSRRTGPELVRLAMMRHFGPYFTSLMHLPLPCDLDPMMPIQLEETLLKAIRLRFEDGELELAPGFRSFAEICDALAPDLGEPHPLPRQPARATLGSAFDAAVESGQLQPSPFRPRWQISPWDGKGEGQEAPPCPRCGEKIRSGNSPRPARRGSANPPWNAGWDGTCEQCGFTFGLELEQRLHFHAHRTLRVQPRNDFHQTFYDEAIVLSGVEITVERQDAGREQTAQTVFLSMSELAALLDALKGDLSVFFAQYDWSEDWT
jgi:serine/threonine protein kinase